MKLARVTLIFWIGLGLAACSDKLETRDVVSKSVVVTDPAITPRNSFRIKPANKGSDVIMGFLSGSNIEAKKNSTTHELSLTGEFTLHDEKNQILAQTSVSLKGDISTVGTATLLPVNERPEDLKVRARVTCLSNSGHDQDCDSAIIDIFAKYNGVIHAMQIETDLSASPKNRAQPKHPVTSTKAPEKKTPVESQQITTPPVNKTPVKQTQTQKPVAPVTTSAPTQKTASAKTTEPVKKPAPVTTAEPTQQAAPIKTPQAAPKKAAPAPGQSKRTDNKDDAPKAPAPEAPVNHHQQSPAQPTQPDLDQQMTEPGSGSSADSSDTEGEGEDTSAQEGVDPTDRESIYVGTLYQGADSLFQDDTTVDQPDGESAAPANPNGSAGAPTSSPQPPKRPENLTPDKDRPQDQAQKSPDNGSLMRASSLKEKATSSEAIAQRILILQPSRERYYGTYELIQLIDRLSSVLYDQLHLGNLWVGDLSKKQGGRIGHISHQNGLDVDIAYPLKAKGSSPQFIDMVKNGAVSSKMDLSATWTLFKAAQSSGALDRIFVDKAIKKSLCQQAEDKGELNSNTDGSAQELLRRLRPTPGHDNHFHVRIRCSIYQPKCRMMGDPPAGSGC